MKSSFINKPALIRTGIFYGIVILLAWFTYSFMAHDGTCGPYPFHLIIFNSLMICSVIPVFNLIRIFYGDRHLVLTTMIHAFAGISLNLYVFVWGWEFPW